MNIGNKVIIIKDCREPETATGQIGIFEGYHNYSDGFENPKIKLNDGSYIWGIECWWQDLSTFESLEKSKKEVEEYIDSMTKEIDKIWYNEERFSEELEKVDKGEI